MPPPAENRKVVAIEGQRLAVPVSIHWIAQDADGAWWGYEAEPLQQQSGWYENEVGAYLRLSRGEANPAWRTTLRRV